MPFVVALLRLLPRMVNVHWLGQSDTPSLGSIYGRFFTLNPEDLTGITDHFTPAHLWFILYLFMFSLTARSIFRLLRLAASRRTFARLATVPGAIYLFVIPLSIARSADLLGLGLKDLLPYFLVFLLGYMLMSQPRFQEAIDRYLWLSFGLALGATLTPKALP